MRSANSSKTESQKILHSPVVVHVSIGHLFRNFPLQQMGRVVDCFQTVRIEMGRTVDHLVVVSVHTDVDRIDDRKTLVIVQRLTSHLVERKRQSEQKSEECSFCYRKPIKIRMSLRIPAVLTWNIFPSFVAIV